MAARLPPLLRVCTCPLRDFSGLLTLWPLWLLLSPDLLAPLGWGRCLSTLGTPSSPSAHLVRQHLLKINTLYQRKHWFHHLCRVDHGQEGQWIPRICLLLAANVGLCSMGVGRGIHFWKLKILGLKTHKEPLGTAAMTVSPQHPEACRIRAQNQQWGNSHQGPGRPARNLSDIEMHRLPARWEGFHPQGSGQSKQMNFPGSLLPNRGLCFRPQNCLPVSNGWSHTVRW